MLFDQEEPLGKRLRVAWGGATDVEVVGIAENIRHIGSEHRAATHTVRVQPAGAEPVHQPGSPHAWRPDGGRDPRCRRRCVKWIPDQGTAAIVSMEQLVAGSIAGPRLQTILLGAFGVLGLMLACIGVYAVIVLLGSAAHARDGHTLALGRRPECHPWPGASRGHGAGNRGSRSWACSAALALTRYLSTLLYTVKATDPAVFAAVSAAARSGGRGRLLVPRATCHGSSIP